MIKISQWSPFQKAVVPIVAKAAEEPTSSEGPKDDTKVAPINVSFRPYEVFHLSSIL